ncbi:MAG: hypothetical protein E6L04_05065 [Thaumarchaeota archaeon]|nr:MAG: hypothetical protein E6L04_05065 [Nitrososphaerota archaeon]TLX88103.1 MAG: hypothetical protein E6K97_07555 [Nitrososphaerota archaeon]
MNDEASTAIDSVNIYEDEGESETTKNSSLNEIFASQMKKSGLTVETIPLGSLNLEREDYYNNDIGSNPRLITNRGCIKIKNKEITVIQIIQRN